MAIRRLALIALVVGVFGCTAAIPAEAQWSHGSYQVDTVVEAVGNFSYSANANNGNVHAVFPPSNQDYSRCAVIFKVQWTKAGPPPFTGTTTYAGDLSGGCGTGSTSSASVQTSDGGGGFLTKTTASHGNPFSFANVQCAWESAPSGNFWAHVNGIARVDKGTGTDTSSYADAVVYTSM
jgi:hypothetical protein